MIDKLLLLAALGHGNLDPMPGAHGQRFRQYLLAVDLVGEQHKLRGRLVRIELRQKGIEHLARRQAAVGARVIGAIAPVLEGAEKEHLDRELPRLFADREDIRLLGVARIDALLSLDR